MFCPKCGTSVEEGTKVCPACGLEFDKVNNPNSQIKSESEVSASANYNSGSKVAGFGGGSVVRIIYFGLAVVVLIMFFMAASSITDGGNEIMSIQSVGGKTLEEAYYQELGNVYAGYAMISRAMGIFFASVLAWLGLRS
jgi:predicted PurR-regulated permease PerM